MEKYVIREYMKKSSLALVVEQLKLRGEDVILADHFERHDVLIKDKDIRIKIKSSIPMQRSRCIGSRWEFTKLIHRSRLWPSYIFDFYILVGFGENRNIVKIWNIPTDDNIIYRKNQIFIPTKDVENDYVKYELKIIDDPLEEFRWFD